MHTSVLVFNNQPMLVLESIVSYKMCTVTSRDDSSSIQCFLFNLVFAPCIILALKYGRVLIQTGKISGTAFHGIKSFPKLLNFYILTEQSFCVTTHCLLFHMFVLDGENNINIIFAVLVCTIRASTALLCKDYLGCIEKRVLPSITGPIPVCFPLRFCTLNQWFMPVKHLSQTMDSARRRSFETILMTMKTEKKTAQHRRQFELK